MRINLYNEDCLIGMKRIPDASVDCVLTELVPQESETRPFFR